MAPERDGDAQPSASDCPTSGTDAEVVVCETDYTEALPDVFILSIFALLDAQSLVRAQSVSRRWLRLGREQVLWKRLGKECADFSSALELVKRVTGAEPTDWLGWCAPIPPALCAQGC